MTVIYINFTLPLVGRAGVGVVPAVERKKEFFAISTD